MAVTVHEAHPPRLPSDAIARRVTGCGVERGTDPRVAPHDTQARAKQTFTVSRFAQRPPACRAFSREAHHERDRTIYTM